MSVWDDIVSTVDDPDSLQRLQPLLNRLDDTPEDVQDDSGIALAIGSAAKMPVILLPGHRERARLRVSE